VGTSTLSTIGQCNKIVEQPNIQLVTGTVILTRGGTYSKSYSFGRVVVYRDATTLSYPSWGNICRLVSFSSNVSDVICHQLGYSGSSEWTYASNDIFGFDAHQTHLSDVSCSNSQFLTLFQCSGSAGASINSDCTDNDDVGVICYSTRIWNNPSPGSIRLSGGNFSNDGLLEIYCGTEWGTVCDNTFTRSAATVACQQLGYKSYYQYDYNMLLYGTSTQPILLQAINCPTTEIRCLTDCQSCDTSVNAHCVHSDDVTLQCYSDDISNSNNRVIGDCTNYSVPVTTIVLASIFGGFICLPYLCCLCVCACKCLQACVEICCEDDSLTSDDYDVPKPSTNTTTRSPTTTITTSYTTKPTSTTTTSMSIKTFADETDILTIKDFADVSDILTIKDFADVSDSITTKTFADPSDSVTATTSTFADASGSYNATTISADARGYAPVDDDEKRAIEMKDMHRYS
jgi:deleted-in-malignant-brain-tumors protein 1